MRAWRASLLALSFSALACSSGRQALGYERSEAMDGSVAASADGDSGSALDFSGDTQLPWFGGPAYHARWPNGLPPSLSYIPIGVWLQSPENAERYRAAGINLFIGLWQGPTDEQLDALPAPDVRTFCGQSGVWQSRLDDPAIGGWMRDDDSPDNAQELPEGGYGPCVEPSVVQDDYLRMSTADPSRPVFLLLGQGVADTEWVGRGSCSGQTEMYREYAQAADVLGFHVYPRSRDLPLSVIATGTDNLLEWSDRKKPVIALIEASNIDGVARPTPEDIRAEVWLALVRGAAGVAYFCHRFMPDFSETDCLDDAPTERALGRINREISSLAPALNSPMVANGVVVESDVKVATRLARVAGVTYLFAVALDEQSTHASFALRGFTRSGAVASAEVIGEGRSVQLDGGRFEDDFDGYGVHLYRVQAR